MCSGGGSCTTLSPRTPADYSCADYTGGAWCASGTGSRACDAVGSGATYSSSACPSIGRVGSCIFYSGATSEVVVRFYPPGYTTARAEAACHGGGGRFVAN